MIPDNLYYTIYLVLITIPSLGLMNRYSKMSTSAIHKIGYKNQILSLIFVLGFALWIGFRPATSKYFGDTIAYNEMYEYLKRINFRFSLNLDNVIFDNLFYWMAFIRIDISYFFVVISIIYFIAAWVACMKFFNKNALLAYFVFLAAFSTFSYGTNGIKAGAAASLFLVALAYREKLKVAIIFLFLSIGFHHSMIMPICAYILAYFYKNPKAYFYGWCVCVLIALAHITFFQVLFAGFSDAKGAMYLNAVDSSWSQKSGFRYDFVLYSAVPIAVGYWAIFKKGIKDKGYIFLLNVYLTTNSIWMLCMYASFSNRIAYLSWQMYPIVLIYPLVNCKWGATAPKTLVKLVAYNLFFTLFMTFVYYA